MHHQKTVHFCTQTHKGKIKRNNQDCLAVGQRDAFAVIADGVGGNAFGEVASQLCVDSCMEYIGSLERNSLSKELSRELANAIKVANEEVITIQRNEPKYEKMSSTLVCFYINDKQLHYSWVGDSRVYLIRLSDQTIRMLTTDHTLDRSKIDPELAPQFYKQASSILTRVVGSILLLKPDVGATDIRPGDIVLACTDGLSNLVPDELILEYAIKFDQAEIDGLRKFSDKLLDRALDCGGYDNISLVLAKVID